MTGSLTARQAALFVAVITCVAFLNSFAGTFVLDDIQDIEHNPALEQLFPPWDAMFVGNKLPARPLPYLTFAIDRAIWGVRPFGYHVTNLLVHVSAALALFSIVRITLLSPRLRGRWGDRAVPLAMVIAMIWAVHPLQTQAVTYVYQRIESMTGMFCLVSLACYAQAAARATGISDTGTRSPPAWSTAWLTGSVAAAAAAMASKENAVVLPLVILAYDWFFVAPEPAAAWPESLRGRRWYYALLASTWLLIGLQLATQASNYQEFNEKNHPPFQYALTQSGVILHYLRLAILPVGQQLDYSSWPVATSVWQVLPALVTIVALLAATVTGTLRRRAWAWLGVVFFLTLAPTSSIMPIEAVANEHRMYLALAAVVAAIVLGSVDLADWIAARRPARLPGDSRIPAAVAAAVIMLLVVTTQLRNQLYAKVGSIWLDVLANDPDNYRANWMMASLFDSAGDPETAGQFAERSLRAKPTTHVFTDLASGHVQRGDLAGAEALCRRGLALQRELLPPNDKAVLATIGDLAMTLRLAGKRDEAESLSGQSINAMTEKLGPDDPVTLTAATTIAEGLSRQGDHAAAERRARETLEVARRARGGTDGLTNGAAVSLARILAAAGRPDEAEQVVRASLAEVGRSRRGRIIDTSGLDDALVEILLATGRIDEAVAMRRRLATEAAARYGLEHQQSQATATKLAVAMATQATAKGDHAEAVRLYGLLVDGYTQSVGPDHPDTRATREKLMAAREAAGQR
jgi:tetratricopeptide (TPR) repeat protein